jgi:hypothetical protein
MPANFRRGMKAMAEAQESQARSGSNPYPAFCPEIKWVDDREEKFIAFLNRPEDIPTVALHTFVPVGTATSKAGKEYTKYESFIDRTDPGVGEDKDDLTERLGHRSQQRSVAVAVELEPTYVKVNGRNRPNGFQVKTETYTRKTEDGGTEEVEAPLVGLVIQSPRNFFGWVGSFHESTAPIEETPLQVIRRGKDAGTAYDFTPFLDQKIDYTNLFNNVDGIAYLRGELDEIDLHGEPLDVALALGSKMLEKRLDELADGERYERLVSPIEEIEDRWGNSATPAKPTVDRPSQREARPTSNGGNQVKFDELRKMHESV